MLSAYFLLGADVNALDRAWDAESKALESWVDSPGEISTYDWRDYVGRREYVLRFLTEDGLINLGLAGINARFLISLKTSSSLDTPMIGESSSRTTYFLGTSRFSMRYARGVCRSIIISVVRLTWHDMLTY